MADKTFTHAPLVGKAVVGPDGVPVYTFRMTSETIDRQGEVVTLDGWSFDRYLTNPVVLDTHDYDSIESIVGRCVSIDRDADGWNATVRFNGSEYGTLAQRLVEDGDLRAVSVGFRPLVIEYPDANALRRARTLDDATEKALISVAPDPATAVRHVEKELLEISVVPIPANPDAIRIRSMNGAATAVTMAPVSKAMAPDWMRDNARQGVAWYEDGKAGDGVTDQTVREAREMASGNVTEDKAARMVAWFARHMADLDAPAAERGHPDYPSPGVVAHALWGGGSRTESERATAWARAHAKAADASATTRAMVDNRDEDVMTTDAWPAVACAMHAVMLDTGLDDATRRRVYVGLERAYSAFGKQAPTLVGPDVVSKLGATERDGMFWHGEPLLAKAGRVLSGANEMRLRQALDLLTQVLASMGGGDVPAAPEVPGPEPYGTEALAAEVAGLKALMELWK